MGKTRDNLGHPIVRRYGAVTKAKTRTRLIALTATAGLVLTGCAAGPDKTGAAAIIGNTVIPMELVQQRFDDWVKANPDAAAQHRKAGQLGTVGRRIASTAISRELVKEVAKKLGVTYREEEVQSRINKAGGAEAAAAKSLETPANYRESVRAQLLAVEIGRKIVDNLSVTVDYTMANTYGEAQSKAREMARGDAAAAALIAKDAKAQANPQTGQPTDPSQLTNQRFDVGVVLQQQNPAVLLPLFTARVGEAVATSLNSGQQTGGGKWLVARIKSRTDQVSGPSAQGSLAEQLNETGLEAFGQTVVSYYAAEQNVQLNPRYGVWTPTAFEVDKRASDPSTPANAFIVNSRGEMTK